MSPVSPSTFGLYEDVPEATLDPEWRTLVHQHAHTLAGMLQRLQTVVAEFHRHIDALRLQTLATDAERFLVAQALQHVHLEREQGQRCALATILVLLDKAHQTEDILGPYEPGHRGEDDAYDHNGIAIREGRVPAGCG